MTKHYEHDCDDCVSLGDYRCQYGTLYELYFCKQMGVPTVIARYGNEGSAYSSGIPSGLPELKEALNRAINYGLLKVVA